VLINEVDDLGEKSADSTVIGGQNNPGELQCQIPLYRTVLTDSGLAVVLTVEEWRSGPD